MGHQRSVTIRTKHLASFLIAAASLHAQTPRPHTTALAEFSAAVEELCASVSPAVVQIASPHPRRRR